MSDAMPILEIWRGSHLESLHMGHVAVCDAKGNLIEAHGNPETAIFPRSSCKMLQALPLVESGAADAAGLSTEHLALSCASHSGEAGHTDRVLAWLSALDFKEDDLICGTQEPKNRDARNKLILSGKEPGRAHNNCSGKHTGFLTLTKHLKAHKNYVDLDHPVQKAIAAAHEEMTELAPLGYGIDGCSAPNFMTTVTGLARAAAKMTVKGSSVRHSASARLVEAMMKHPELVAGTGRSCTELMTAACGRAAVKTGAEGIFLAILPERGIGIALKASDGAQRASNAAIAALLVKYGIFEENDPVVQKYITGPIRNWDGLEVGHMRVNENLLRA